MTLELSEEQEEKEQITVEELIEQVLEEKERNVKQIDNNNIIIHVKWKATENK